MSDAPLLIPYRYRATIMRITGSNSVDALVDLGFRIEATLRLRLTGLPEVPQGTERHALLTDLLRDRIEGRDVIVETDREQCFPEWFATIYWHDTNINEQLLVDAVAGNFPN